MNISIDTHNKIAIIDVGKMTTLNELQDAVLALLTHPDHVDGMEAIFDFREADLVNISREDINSYAKWLYPYLPKLAVKVATVVSRDLEFGIVRMWNTYSEGIIDQSRMIFREMDAAQEWLLSSRS